MNRRTLLALALAILAAIIAYISQERLPSETALPPRVTPPATLSKQDGRYLFYVTLHTPKEIAGMLERAERLAQAIPTDQSRTGIALVLHGPEIEIFANKNYRQFQRTVNLAARLNAEHIIEVKMCRTEMQRRGIGKEDVPAFIEIVPYGPDEEERLCRSGYVYL